MQSVLHVPSESAPRFDYPGWWSALCSVRHVGIMEPSSYAWRDLRALPAYLSGVSFVFLLFTALAYIPAIEAKLSKYISYPSKDRDRRSNVLGDTSFWEKIKTHISYRGGITIYTFHALRLLGCTALVTLSVTTAMLEGRQQRTQEPWSAASASYEKSAEFALAIAYLYTSILSLLTLATGPIFRRACSMHAGTVLLASFGVFSWRNLLPLTMYHGIPADAGVKWLFWSRLSLVTAVAVLIPLFIPRFYRSVDPANTASVPNPEQTASIFSFIFYTFLDGVVLTAWRLRDVPYDRLPLLADYDRAKHIAGRSLDNLDPVTRKENRLPNRYLLWGLMELFRWDYACMSVLLVLKVLVGFLGPVGLYRLLNYLETGGKDASVRPWAWILLLFLNPVLLSITSNLYLFIASRMVVQAESILLQLMFQHSLKVRLTEESPSSVSSGRVPTGLPTPSQELEATDDISTQDGSPRNQDLHNGSLVAGSLLSTAPSEIMNNEDRDASEPSSAQVAGKINNIVGTDIANLMDGRNFVVLIFEIPLQIGITIWFLYAILGWAALLGMGVMLIGFTLPGRVAHLLHRVQVERMKKTDARVQAATETMNVLRMIKLFGWEAKAKDLIAAKRDEELEWVKRRKILAVLNGILNLVLPFATMVATFAFYTLVMKQELTASRVFSSMVLFESLRNVLRSSFHEVPQAIQAKVSLDRIDDFLNKTELLDRYRPTADLVDVHLAQFVNTDQIIGFHDATFTWTESLRNPNSPRGRNFRLHIEDLIFQRSAVNLIVGPTGCGKTSILMALLGEMHFLPNGPDSWFNLPKLHGVAYAAQESWLQNETIKQNILFGEPYEADRYKQVVYQCALERDLDLFDAGHETEVGERGLTLSGGQKARITLARAIYSRAQVLLLDDVLSSLDVHTSRWIVDKCFSGNLVKDRTIILVTHNVALASPVAGRIISLGKNGHVISQGSNPHIAAADPVWPEETMKEGLEDVKDGGEIKPLQVKLQDSSHREGKLVLEEEKAEGRLSWAALKLLFDAFGGPQVWLLIIACFLAGQVHHVLANWWLGRWASAYEDASTGATVNVVYHVSVYAGIVSSFIVVLSSSNIFYTLASIRAGRKIHKQLCDSVVGSKLRWLDSTPVSRIISRFTQDVREIDGPLVEWLEGILAVTMGLLASLGAIVVFAPVFLLPGVVLAAVGIWLGQVYMVAQLSVKRDMSNFRSPLYSQFGAAVAGLISIRAYGAESLFEHEMAQRIDNYSRPARTAYNLERWISIRIDVLGGFFSAGLAAYLVYVRTGVVGASNTGLILGMATIFSGMILFWVQALNQFETAGNSLERILDYLKVDQEPSATEEGRPPAYWPATGSIRVENLCARYYDNGPIVLDDLNFDIKSGERVGIVGRTGSGKSSLTLSLCRMIPTTGEVYLDGRPTHQTNLDALRTNLTIIPQDPTLMSGTLRTNLDPFSQHDDAILNDALRSAGLFRLQSDDDENKITLDTSVTSGGENFSVGQRQIIALARAIVRDAKVLILDEATASVDADTDDTIQEFIRRELSHATLITIAHRLQTVADYDKIMVLDAGRLVEFDTPIALLEKEGSLFRALVNESSDKDVLWTMARNGRATAS